jgi:predicted transcriptional regulator
MISKVQMVIGNRIALVDSDQVDMRTRKTKLVAEAMALTASGRTMELEEVIKKIQRLNRTIRKNVQFL